MTKALGILTAALLAVSVAHARQTAASQPADTTDATLIANERALLDAVAKADKASFSSLFLTTDGVWTTKTGFVPAGLLVNGLDAFKVTKWEIVNPHVTRLDAESAVVLYSWTGAGTFGNQPLAPVTLASTVWTRRNGKWQAVHHQETDLVK
jgi:hypothetical protein